MVGCYGESRFCVAEVCEGEGWGEMEEREEEEEEEEDGGGHFENDVGAGGTDGCGGSGMGEGMWKGIFGVGVGRCRVFVCLFVCLLDDCSLGDAESAGGHWRVGQWRWRRDCVD